MRKLRILGILLLIAFSTGCASTSIRTRKAEDFEVAIDKLFVVAKVADSWSDLDARLLHRLLKQKLSECVLLRAIDLYPKH